MKTYRLEHNPNYFLSNVHDPEQCQGRPCTIHSKTMHHMRGWPQHWREDRKIMERVNPFGGACPDPDSPWDNDSAEWLHGCIINPAYPSMGICGAWYINGSQAAWVTKEVAVTQNGLVYSYKKRGYKELPNYDKFPEIISRDKTVLIDGQWKYIDAVVMKAWHGQRPVNHVVVHLDGDDTNNNLRNLEWRHK